MPWFMTPFGPHFVVEPGTIDEYERRDYTAMGTQEAADYFAGSGYTEPAPSFATEAQVVPLVTAAVAAGAGSLPAALRADFVAATVVVGTGIDPTGSTNSSTAIQAKITAAGPDGVVYFPKGTYRAADLEPLAGQTWTGPGVLQRVAGSTASIVSGTDLADVTLDELTFDGARGASTASSNAAVSFTRATGLRVQRCTIRNTPAANPALELRGSIDALIQGNSFTTVGYGINLGLAAGSTDAVRNNAIMGNQFADVDLNPIFLTENLGSSATAVVGRVLDTIVVGNTLLGWGDAGIESGSGCVRTVISGNVLNGNGEGAPSASGILIRDNTGTLITGNSVSGLPAAGASKCIAVIALNGTTADLTLAGNQTSGGAANGIFVNNCEGLSVTGGSVYDAGADGIVLENVTGFTVCGVRVAGNGQHGISLGVFGAGSASRGSVTGCTVFDNASDPGAANARDGIAVLGTASTDLTITGNQVTDTHATGKTQRYGITVQGTGTNRYVITGNNLNGNASGGLNDNGGTTKVVANNLT